MKTRAVVLLGVTLLFSPGSSMAARIYQLVDYPALQEGQTLSGTITTNDNAPDDGLLVTDEIVDWQWGVVGQKAFSASFAPDGSRTVAIGAAISPASISLPLDAEVAIDNPPARISLMLAQGCVASAG